jgi:hypothetical protein
MQASWSTWKRFPNARRGEHMDAPIGPGAYVVRSLATGETIACDYAANVASALASLAPRPPLWARLLPWSAWQPQDEYEYRTCATATVAQGKTVAQSLLDRRRVYWRRRAALGWT